MWENKFETGIDFLDSEHRRLVALIESCIQVARNSGTTEQVIELLNEIASHLALHFNHEEAAMSAASDHRFDAHMAQHKYLLEKINTTVAQFKSGSAPVSAQEVLYVLFDWYAIHNTVEDRKLANFLHDADAHAKSGQLL